jgi:hypothetical protein
MIAQTSKGSPKPVATGKKGNVGGIATPGRHGNHAAAMLAGVNNLVAAGPGTTKTADVHKIRPEKNNSVHHTPMKTTPTMRPAKPAGVVKPHGSVSVAAGIRPEGPIKRDSASVVKPMAKK